MMGYTVSAVQVSANRRTAFLLAQALSTPPPGGSFPPLPKAPSSDWSWPSSSPPFAKGRALISPAVSTDASTLDSIVTRRTPQDRVSPRGLSMHELRRILLPRLSEKGSEGGFESGVGRYEEAEMGPKEPSRWSVGPRQGCFQGFSDGLSTHLSE